LSHEVQRSSIPEHPTLGTALASIIGKNVGPLSVTLVISELMSLFKSDPTFASAKVAKVEFLEDTISITFEFNSVLQNVNHNDYMQYTFTA
jgi:hypothetical protein